MKRFFLLIFCIPLMAHLSAQTEAELKREPVEIKWTGFIMNNVFFDSRKMFNALDGLVSIFPLPEQIDYTGEDINDAPTVSLLSLASRLRAQVSGPKAFGAETSGYLEFDFTSRANSATLRFRQAWVNLNWGSTSLLIGRTWNPLVSTDVLPDVIGMNIGLPFQPFNRSDQLTLTQKAGNFHLIFSAAYQNDYLNNGPNGRLYSYQNNALLPNLHTQIKYKTEHIILGIGIDYKRLKPREYTISPLNGEKFISRSTIGCPAILSYAQISNDMFSFRMKSIISGDISENIMTGAYGIKSQDPETGNEEYTTYKHWFIWNDLRYGKKIKAGIFYGYLKNLGATSDILVPDQYLPMTVFGLGEKISHMYRISPSVSCTSGKVMVACEVENNITSYGDISYADRGKVVNSKSIRSTRILGTLYYFF